jgi:aryl-alcohol dehydrogenase-like predicted oxidoreductase
MNDIEPRKLGASDLVVPTLGIGTGSWGEKMLGYGKQYTREDITQAYRACLDAGLNYFDTAERYGKGESERLLGACRRLDGRPVIIATKFAPPTRFSPSFSRSSPRALLEALDGSLKRLSVDRIDLYQLHYPPAAKKLDAYVDVLAEAARAGKIRAVGVCNFNAPLMRQANAILARHGIPPAFNQVGYSLLKRYPETNGVLDACRELDVALIAYMPLSEGILSGKYRAGAVRYPGAFSWFFRLSQLDPFKQTGGSTPVWRHLFSRPRVLQREKLEPLFVALEETAKAHGKTMAQVALNWLITSDPRVIPIPGAKNERQALENAGALGWSLTKEEHARIGQADFASR